MSVMPAASASAIASALGAPTAAIVPMPARAALSTSSAPARPLTHSTPSPTGPAAPGAAAARRSAEAYACADLLLQATPFAPMPAFPHRRAVGLLARSPSSSGARARASLGLAPEERSCLVAFQPASAPSLALPPARAGRRFLVPSGWAGHRERGDVVRLPADLPFADAIAAADVVLGKPGYGLIGDLEVAGARFLYAPRPGFPENAVLEAHLSARAGTRAIAPARLASGDWEAELEALESAPRPAAMEAGGCLRAARAILDLLAVDRRGESA